jgi:protein gp37
MSDKTAIEWTDATWNPVTGCTKVSPGCDNCYAETFAERWRGTPGHYFENGFDVQLRPDKLDQPLRWARPRRIFVNSMSDLFHEQINTAEIAQVFAVMSLAEQHTFQLLTKRHGRMRNLLNDRDFVWLIDQYREKQKPGCGDGTWPIPNLWLGVSVEEQKWADIRVPALLDTPAAVRFLSCEPLLGPIDFQPDDHTGHERDYDGGPEGGGFVCLDCSTDEQTIEWTTQAFPPGIDWVIAGGESGHGARPMHPDWARTLRDQCETAGVAYLFKQWGEWGPNGQLGIGNTNPRQRLVGEPVDAMGHREVIERLGKKAAGRELDGRTWDEFPQAVTA